MTYKIGPLELGRHALEALACLTLGLLVGPTTLWATPSSLAGDTDSVVLAGHVHPLAQPEHDIGPTDPSLRLEHLLLVLNIGAERGEALARLLLEQQDPASPRYHRWLTPEEFGALFGPSPEEITLVSDWLRSQGFAVNDIPRSRTWINFSGTVADVNRAFAPEMHDYSLDGKRQRANAAAPTIPRSLSGFVAGIVGLNDFQVHAAHTPPHSPQGRKQEAKCNNCALYVTHSLAPGDFAIIYGVDDVYAQGIDGTGQEIAIVGRSDIDLGHVTDFRSHFNLPAAVPSGGPPAVVVHPPLDVCPPPGFTDSEVEADLDVQWSGAVAKNATVLYVPCGSDGATDGTYLSAGFIVDGNIAPVMSMSFGICEASGDAAAQWISNLWAQAASQGISVFVASGDAGAAGCNDPKNDDVGTLGRSVNLLCSTPYSVCVGGTEFADDSAPSYFWGSTADPETRATALRYIDEEAWNESELDGGSGLWATGGGESSIFKKPSWQMGLTPSPDDWRYVPDVSLTAAEHDGYLIYQGLNLAKCLLGLGHCPLTVIGGTSAAAPTFAALMALVVQRTGQRQGNPNPVLYQLAAMQSSGAIGTVFHDVLVGDNTVPGVEGFSCTSGYDLATGLGSVNASALVGDWPFPGAHLTVAPNPGFAPLLTRLTASVSGEGFGTVNYTFWWDCPYDGHTVQAAIAICGDPRSNPAIGMKLDGVEDLEKTVSWTYPNPGTYEALVIVERNGSSIGDRKEVVVSPPPTCTSFSIAPVSTSPDHAAGSRQVAIIGSPTGCAGGSWTASGNGSWLTVFPTAGTGPRTVTVSWTANASTSPRAGTAILVGNSFHVSQAGATAGAPSPPFLLAPGASVFPGTTASSLSPPFFWVEVPGADSYQLELSDSTTVFPVATIYRPQTVVVLAGQLMDHHAYKWRMRSHNAGGWGAYGALYYFSTYSGNPTRDFSLSSDPPTTTISPGASAAVIIRTATVQGSEQTLTFGAGSLPTGISSIFSDGSALSGDSVTLTLFASSEAIPGVYTIAVSGMNAFGVTRSIAVGLTVTPPATTGEPSICLNRASLGFSDQMVGTSSPTQLVTIRNCGNGPLHIASLGASPDFFIGDGSLVPPLDLPAGGATTFQVGFAPLGAGARTGSVKIFSNSYPNPAVLPLSGNATPAPVTTGTIDVQATLNGEPFIGTMYFSLTGPGGTLNFGSVPLSRPDQAAGSYSVALVGSAPGGGSLTSITPASTQILEAGGSILFTFNATGVNEFSFTCPTGTYTGFTELMVTTPGGSASVPLQTGYILGGSQTVSLAVTGLPAGATASFDPQPIVMTLDAATFSSTFTVSTAPQTPPGIYQFELTATNQDGVTHSLDGILVVVASAFPQLVSKSMGGAPAAGSSDLPSVSSDGRYIAFGSNAPNLVPGDTNGRYDVFVYDRLSGATSRVSVAQDGSQGDDVSNWPALSGDGRFVAFHSVASNLIPGGRSGFLDVYVRDRDLGRTNRVSVSSAGAAADSNCYYPSISGDGRFVAFDSKATNLVPGGSGEFFQVYVRDLLTNETSIASVGNDGSVGDGDSMSATLSGDGRFVAFYSSATNFVPGATSAGRQVFLRDRWAGTIQVVSGAPDGSPANGIALLDRSYERLGVSPDGRFVAFTSSASNLTPGDVNLTSDVFVWDRTTGTSAIASVTNESYPLLFAYAPAVSADGRFVAFRPSIAGGGVPQIAVRDMLTKRTVLYSVGPGGAVGSKVSLATALSADGRVLAFSSEAPNLIAGDTNGQTDAFSVLLPISGSIFAQSLTTSLASIPGGSTATGSVTLSSTAPSGGVSVSLFSSSIEAQVPSVVTVSGGSRSATFVVSTLSVPSELPITLTASYGGGSPWTTLRLTKAPPARIDVLAGDGQKAAVGATLPVSLSVRVVDSANNPVPQVLVKYSAPTSGPSASFSGGAVSVLVETDSFGIAVAPDLTANAVTGQYGVVASAEGLPTPAVFSLENLESGIFADGFESGTLAAWSAIVP